MFLLFLRFDKNFENTHVATKSHQSIKDLADFQENMINLSIIFIDQRSEAILEITGTKIDYSYQITVIYYRFMRKIPLNHTIFGFYDDINGISDKITI